MDERTAEPGVVIEERRLGYIRYRRLADGRRWEVWGICDRRGDCLVGSVIETTVGPVEIRDRAHLETLRLMLGRHRIDHELDVPVGPGFTGCCPLRVVEL